MCIGIPMKVLACDDEFSALCEGNGGRETISMLLVGKQPVGAHVLVHLGSAVRVLEEEEAELIGSALAGLGAAIGGGDFERHFADLINREPELPAHLKRS
jgi:hydrogenase expression/formation protein HypC